MIFTKPILTFCRVLEVDLCVKFQVNRLTVWDTWPVQKLLFKTLITATPAVQLGSYFLGSRCVISSQWAKFHVSSSFHRKVIWITTEDKNRIIQDNKNTTTTIIARLIQSIYQNSWVRTQDWTCRWRTKPLIMRSLVAEWRKGSFGLCSLLKVPPTRTYPIG